VTLDDNAQAALQLTGKYLTKAMATIGLKSPSNSTATVATDDIKVSDSKDTGLTITARIPADYAKAGVTATITVKTSAGKSNSVVFTLQPK
jgi:hypothetical protein